MNAFPRLTVFCLALIGTVFWFDMTPVVAKDEQKLAKAAYERGEYDEAIRFAVVRLKQKAGDKNTMHVLVGSAKEAYRKHLDTAAFAKARGDHDTALKEYETLRALDLEINSLPPHIKYEKQLLSQALPKIEVDLLAEIKSLRGSAAERQYWTGQEAYQRRDYRKRQREFEEAATLGYADSGERKWVDVNVSVPWDPEESFSRIEQRAILEGKRLAIESLGSDVVAISTTAFLRLERAIIRVLSRGRIVEMVPMFPQAKIKDAVVQEATIHLAEVKFRALVEKLSDNSDPNFFLQIVLKNGRPENVYAEGDELSVEISCNRDSYLYLFNVLPDDSIRRIVPSELVPEPRNRLRANVAFSLKDLGIRLRLRLPEGKKTSLESVIAIATKQRLDLHFGFPTAMRGIEQQLASGSGRTGLSVLHDRLARLSPGDWVDDLITYEIRKP